MPVSRAAQFQFAAFFPNSRDVRGLSINGEFFNSLLSASDIGSGVDDSVLDSYVKFLHSSGMVKPVASPSKL